MLDEVAFETKDVGSERSWDLYSRCRGIAWQLLEDRPIAARSARQRRHLERERKLPKQGCHAW